MDLKLELRRTSKLIVPSPKRGLGFRCFPFPALPCRALDSSVPSGLVCGRDLGSGGTGTLLEAVKKRPALQVERSGDRESMFPTAGIARKGHPAVAFLSRHSRAGLWILPSLPGLVCGRDLGQAGLELCCKR